MAAVNQQSRRREGYSSLTVAIVGAEEEATAVGCSVGFEDGHGSIGAMEDHGPAHGFLVR